MRLRGRRDAVGLGEEGEHTGYSVYAETKDDLYTLYGVG